MSASSSIPGRRQASSPRASAVSPLPLPLTGPAAAPSSARVPHATSAISLAWGNWAPGSRSRAAGCLLPAPGRPNAAALAGLSGTASEVPSHAVTSSPPRCDHGAVPGDSGEHSRRNTDSRGFSPTRRRAMVSAVDDGNAQPAAPSAASSPAAIDRMTCPYASPLNRHRPSVKYTASRAGSDLSRISHASPSPTASSTSPGGTTNDKTPSPTRDSSRPRGDSHPPGMAA